MVRLVPPERLAPQWRVLRLDDNNSCGLLVARPTAQQCVMGLASSPDESVGDFQMRLAALLILDWSDVTEEVVTADGPQVVPVKYSFDGLCRLVSQFPHSVWRLLEIVADATQGITETERKNLPTPPAAGGTITPTEAVNSSGSLDYGMSADGEKRFATASD